MPNDTSPPPGKQPKFKIRMVQLWDVAAITPGGGGDSNIKKVGMLVENFEI